MAFSGAYLGVAPLLAITMLQYSQQWQAADLFRVAPVARPGPLCHGVRRAVLLCLTLPLTILFALIAWLFCKESSQLLLLLPGMIVLPIYALIACLGGKGVPFSLPSQEGKIGRSRRPYDRVHDHCLCVGGTCHLVMVGGLVLAARAGGIDYRCCSVRNHPRDGLSCRLGAHRVGSTTRAVRFGHVLTDC